MSIENLKAHVLNRIAEAVRKAFGQAPEGLEIGFPPDLQLGHFAVGCFPLSKQLRKSPAEIAKVLAAAASADEEAHRDHPEHHARIHEETAFRSNPRDRWAPDGATAAGRICATPAVYPAVSGLPAFSPAVTAAAEVYPRGCH